MAARDRRRFEPGDAFIQPAQDVLPLTEADLAIVQEEAKAEAARRGRRTRLRHLRRLSTEGVAEAVDRANEAGPPRFITERRPELGHDAREVRLRRERPRPQVLLELSLGQGPRPAPQKQLEQLEGLRAEVNGRLPAQELAAPEVGREIAEMEDQRRPRSRAGSFVELVQDFLILATDL